MSGFLTSAHFSGLVSGEAGFWRTLTSEPGFEINHCGTNSAGQYGLPGMMSHNITVQCSQRNSYVASMDGQRRSVRGIRGMSAIRPAGVTASNFWNEPVEVITLGLAPSWVAKVLQGSAFDGGFELAPRFIGPDPLIGQIVFALKDGAEAGQPFGRLLQDSLIAALVAHLANQAAAATAPEPRGGLVGWRLRRVVEYIDERLAENVSLSELAAVAGLSEHHFAQAFRLSMGEPPHRYLVKQRIETAKRMFRGNPSLSVGEVANAVGFTTSNHFANMFRRVTGGTPTAYRDSW